MTRPKLSRKIHGRRVPWENNPTANAKRHMKRALGARQVRMLSKRIRRDERLAAGRPTQQDYFWFKRNPSDLRGAL